MTITMSPTIHMIWFILFAPFMLSATGPLAGPTFAILHMLTITWISFPAIRGQARQGFRYRLATFPYGLH